MLFIIFKNSIKKDSEEENIDVTRKNNEINMNSIKEKNWKNASESIPLEFHIELVIHAYDINNSKIFEDLSNSAYIRCQLRRFEVPYITDIDILMSPVPYPNIENYFEKIPQDLNEAALKFELNKLRNKKVL